MYVALKAISNVIAIKEEKPQKGAEQASLRLFCMLSKKEEEEGQVI